MTALVRENLGADLVCVVYFDGTGACPLSTRLKDGKLCRPAITDVAVSATPRTGTRPFAVRTSTMSNWK